MTERHRIHELVSGSKNQTKDVWFLVKEDDGHMLVLHERCCREKGTRRFTPVAQTSMSLREAMCKGGKLAKNLWYAVPHKALRDQLS